ncbi:FtsX-like permease family protein [Micromonospora sp. ALFpr18c]|uniref:FtsX-like permease family protein n=1 Tax=Micromonospora sp. ALFpr18c TaxID=1458665 RepID=UPI00124BA330|nr:FtsX-like permease family protein [Micromonospora sp. ALFpr18c]KAB1941219.1 FtsX-like permease family protein [Micromonospora sp. ALFpr18c]
MSVGAAVRRVRAYGGQFLLLAALTLVMVLLISGVPRLVNRLTDQGLRTQLSSELPARRDVSYTSSLMNLPAGTIASSSQARLPVLEAQLPAQVRELVDERWYSAEIQPGRVTGPDLAAHYLKVDLGFRAVPGVRDAATIVEGEWPNETYVPGRPTEVALDVDVARKLKLRRGSAVRLQRSDDPVMRPLQPAGKASDLVVVGLFRANDRTDGMWDGLPQLLEVTDPEGEGYPFIALGVTGPAALDNLVRKGWPVRFGWRYRLTADQIDVRYLGHLVEGLDDAQRAVPSGLTLTVGVDGALRAFAAQVDAARTLLAVIASGVLATLAGLIVLAAMLAVRRRRSEFALIRARGGTFAAGARRSLAESSLVVPVAAALGWWLGTLVPGAPDPVAWYGVVVTVLVTLALPLAALGVPVGGAARRDLVRVPPSARRLTVEVSLLLLALLGVVLLRRRGLTLGEVDPPDRFVILPWQALPKRITTPVPTGLLVAGDRLDVEVLRRVGNEGQSRFQRSGAVTGPGRPLGVTVDTRVGVRHQFADGGANGVLVFGFVGGAAGGVVLGLLAIAFSVLAGARARGQVLSRLRTLGLSRRQWRGLLVVELTPLVGVSVLTGALVGTVLPLVLNPVLGLAAFTGGVPVRVEFEPGLVVAVVALGAVALGFAVAVEALNSRRLRLGEVLRLGEES